MSELQGDSELEGFVEYAAHVRDAQERGQDIWLNFPDSDTKDRFLVFLKRKRPLIVTYWSVAESRLHVLRPSPAAPLVTEDEDPPAPIRVTSEASASLASRVQTLEAALVYVVRSAARWGSLNTHDVDHVEKLLREGFVSVLQENMKSDPVWRCGCGHTLTGDPTDGPIHCDQVDCSCLQCRGVEVKT